mgnify:FL=1
MVFGDYNPAAKDDSGLTALERFDQLRAFFLGKLKEHGFPRAELFQELRWGPWGYHSEEQLVRQWAEQLKIPLHHIRQGIDACYANADERRLQITSFRFVIPWIIQRVREGTPL